MTGVLANLGRKQFPTISGVLRILAVPLLFMGGFTLFGRGGIEERDEDSKELNDAKKGLSVQGHNGIYGIKFPTRGST